jgi:CHAT domain-containing protein/tetratricopeptide (TPR) repeat protein
MEATGGEKREDRRKEADSEECGKKEGIRQVTADEKIAALLAESENLDPGKDAARLRALYEEAAKLVDRNEKPKKWAAFRMLYGRVAYPADPQAVLEAFRESLPFWDPVTDRPQWAECKSYIGWSLFFLGRITPPESEEVIECLEATLDDYPEGTPQILALYFEGRTVGDPWENWKKRTHYLQVALAQVSRENDPVQWAKLTNELAVVLPQEPTGDFAKATETRILYHQEALTVLAPFKDLAGSEAQNRWITICVDTSEAYLSRVGTNSTEDRKIAERYARDAYDACSPATPRDTQAFATMALARALLNEDGASLRDQCAEGLTLCGKADDLIDGKKQPVIAATNEKFKALAHLKLLELGDPGHLEDLLRAANLAYSLLDPALYSAMRRTVMQVAAEGLVAARDFPRAIDYLTRAVDAGEENLQQATSRAGRLERIFDLHDSYSLLGYSYFQANDIGSGIEAIDRGKGRLWRSAKPSVTFEQVRTLVPGGGALLFAAFAPKDGVVAVVSERGEQLCPLIGFGSERLKELLLGDIQSSESDSWMARYVYRHTSPDHWRERIDSIGRILFETFWAPVMETLRKLGVSDGAELVVFPQGGLGVLPLHAAWKSAGEGRRWISESDAIRYAPSASCLIANQVRARVVKDPRTLLVSNPPSNLPDLPYSAFEVAWVRECESPERLHVLAGSEAAKEAVVAELRQATLAHFSTHGVFSVADPFQSSLALAGGEKLSLDELLPLMEECGLRELVLSACETAMAPSWRRPDEMIGFPAAFLTHGAKTVLATQWPVDDWAAAALVGRFYREWRNPPCKTAAQALRAAQNWLREVTADELYDLLEPLKDDSGPMGDLAVETRTSLIGMDGKERPFAHPYFWAAFTVSGF